MEDVRPTIMPKAREDRLIIKELPDETLVYDLETDQAHCLNSTASRVWKECDGTRSVSEIRRAVEAEIGAPIDERVIWLGLEQLKKFDLLDVVPIVPATYGGMNRRQVIRSFGVGAALLPVIITMSAPMAHAQGSCIPPGMGAPCSPGGGGTNCCSGVGNCTSGPPASKVCT